MKDFLGFLTAILLLAAAVVGGTFWIVLLLMTPGQLAEIEQLRIDAAAVDPLAAEDVLGQVTSWNQRIAAYRTYNDMFLVGILVPDEWATVAPIPVP